MAKEVFKVEKILKGSLDVGTAFHLDQRGRNCLVGQIKFSNTLLGMMLANQLRNYG